MYTFTDQRNALLIVLGLVIALWPLSSVGVETCELDRTRSRSAHAMRGVILSWNWFTVRSISSVFICETSLAETVYVVRSFQISSRTLEWNIFSGFVVSTAARLYCAWGRDRVTRQSSTISAACGDVTSARASHVPDLFATVRCCNAEEDEGWGERVRSKRAICNGLAITKFRLGSRRILQEKWRQGIIRLTRVELKLLGRVLLQCLWRETLHVSRVTAGVKLMRRTSKRS